MGKYRYQLFINEKKMTKAKREFVYQYGHTKNIKIIVDKNCSYVDLNMGVKKEFSDLCDVKFDILIDAIKKAYLLHILIFKKGLKINSLRLVRNDEEFIYDSSSAKFPYVFSMVDDTIYDFDEQWSNECMINNILTTTKSKRKEDNRFISLYAYLSAKSKKYSIDKFTNLWMAFNAYYSYNAKQNKNKKISNDKDCIDYLLKCIGHGTNKQSRKFLETHKDLYYKAGSELAHVSNKDYKDLYDKLYNKQEVEGFEALKEIAGDTMTLFGAILCEYAYYMRCNYIHGSRTITLLWTYNEHEVSQFNLLICFLERFLGEYIPKMFMED